MIIIFILYILFMGEEKITTQMKKGILEYLILSIISKGDVYANDIISKLKNANLIVVEGTMYPLLSRLKTSKLLDYVWVESVQGPPRKYYKLTKLGEETLKTMTQVWNEICDSVNKITK